MERQVYKYRLRLSEDDYAIFVHNICSTKVFCLIASYSLREYFNAEEIEIYNQNDSWMIKFKDNGRESINHLQEYDEVVEQMLKLCEYCRQILREVENFDITKKIETNAAETNQRIANIEKDIQSFWIGIIIMFIAAFLRQII